ncbi:FGGY-family carbohydrate kinase [Salipiger abyssi]|uniref:FGGY-family carbohydrate kinase n=1 Tax=Salipiger abyssi TaxID=1250539 RepID=UPI0040599EF4
MGSYVIGIDAGGTMTKAALFDEDGRELACARSRNVVHFPQQGWTERDPDVMWRAAATSIRQVLEDAGVSPGEVVGIAPSGYGSGLYLLDRDGNPVRPGINSTDSRTATLMEELKADGRAAEVDALVQQHIWPGQSLMLLLWLQRHEPEVVGRTHRISFCKDFLRARLCGDMSTDYTDAGASGLFDCAGMRWSEEVLRLLDMQVWQAKLPETGPSDEVVGRVSDWAAAQTGLLEGTPVVRGTVDMSAAAMASDLARPDQMSVIAGTFSIASTLHSAGPKLDAVPMLQFPYPRGGWLAAQGSATSASNLEWMVKTVLAHGGALPEDLSGDLYATVNDAVSRVRGVHTDTLFYPYLFGGPDGAPSGLVSMNARTSFDKVMLAVFEGIVFAHKADIDQALSGADAAAPGVIRLAGGATNSPYWTQMFADILGLPVEVPAGSEFGALGVAICAAAATGLHGSLDAAISAMTGIDRRHEVDGACGAVHLAKYPRWQAIRDAMARGNTEVPPGAAMAQGRTAEVAHA